MRQFVGDDGAGHGRVGGFSKARRQDQHRLRQTSQQGLPAGADPHLGRGHADAPCRDRHRLQRRGRRRDSAGAQPLHPPRAPRQNDQASQGQQQCRRQNNQGRATAVEVEPLDGRGDVHRVERRRSGLGRRCGHDRSGLHQRGGQQEQGRDERRQDRQEQGRAPEALSQPSVAAGAFQPRRAQPPQGRNPDRDRQGQAQQFDRGHAWPSGSLGASAFSAASRAAISSASRIWLPEKAATGRAPSISNKAPRRRISTPITATLGWVVE